MSRLRAIYPATPWGSLAVAAIALALRLPHLSDRSFWFDEASSWQTASYGWADMRRSLLLNVHLPLYYVLLKGWMALFGESAAAIRGLSIMFGVVTVLLMDRFGRELFQASAACRREDPQGAEPAEARAFGLVVAVLVAISPFQVFASIEARMYSMGTAFVALSGWVLLRILRTGGGPGMWVAYGLSLLGLLYSHHWGLFSAAAQVVFLGLYLLWLVVAGQRETARRLAVPAVVIGMAVALAYLPALGFLRTQVDRVQQDYWIRPLTWEKLSSTFSQFIVPDPDDIPRYRGWGVAGLVAASSLILMIQARRGEGFVLASALLPMVFAVSAAAITPVWVTRYFRFAHLFMVTSVALAVWRLSRRWPALLALSISCLAAGLLYANVAFWNRLDISHNGGMRAAVATILRQVEPGESIITTDVLQFLPAKFYVGRRAPVCLLEPPFDLMWGWHVIDRNDLISLDEFRRAMARGVWLIGTLPRPIVSPEWDWGEHAPVEKDHEHYYINIHRDIYVHYAKDPNESSSRVSAVGSGED
jgi:mannosyltransferase